MFLFIVVGGIDKKLRLIVGKDNCIGRVEVKVQEEWGIVCNNGWDMDEVFVICRQLGCLIVIKVIGWVNFSVGFGCIWMDYVFCRGNELVFWDCKYDGWGKYNCIY